jgi:hypothetical protein
MVFCLRPTYCVYRIICHFTPLGSTVVFQTLDPSCRSPFSKEVREIKFDNTCYCSGKSIFSFFVPSKNVNTKEFRNI